MASDKREDFPRSHRITRPADYQSIYTSGRKIQSRNFVLFVRENGLAHHRLGITVTKKVGGAVVRNRIKRLFREIYRRCRAEIPHHYDLVVNARTQCVDAGYSELQQEFLLVSQRICR